MERAKAQGHVLGCYVPARPAVMTLGKHTTQPSLYHKGGDTTLRPEVVCGGLPAPTPPPPYTHTLSPESTRKEKKRTNPFPEERMFSLILFSGHILIKDTPAHASLQPTSVCPSVLPRAR